MQVAKQFQEQLQPLLEWLDTTERKVKGLELVPTDEEKIQQKIREHKVCSIVDLGQLRVVSWMVNP